MVSGLRDRLADSDNQFVGVIDPMLPGAISHWQDYADVLILGAADLKWLLRHQSKSTSSIALHKVVVLVASVGHLLDALSTDQRAFGIMFDPETIRHAAAVLDLAAEGPGYIVIPPRFANLLSDDGLRRIIVHELTGTERLALELLGQGLANREIALSLGCSETKVKTLVRSVLLKLRLKNRTAAAVFAARRVNTAAARRRPRDD